MKVGPRASELTGKARIGQGSSPARGDDIPGTVRLGGSARSGGANSDRVQTNLRPNIAAPRGVNGNGIIARGSGGGASREGRLSANQLGNFLSIPNRSGGSDRINGGNSVRGTQVASVSRSPAGNFRNLPASQINRINTNVNTSFRNTTVVNNSSNVNVNNVNNVNVAVRGGNFAGNAHWNKWAGGIHNHCNFNRFNGCFNNRFWATNYCNFPWARSCYWWGARPWSSWWGWPSWGLVGNWFPSYGWSDPYCYDYGPGGNIVYSGGYVYMNGEEIATVQDYAASAAALAEVPVPANPDQPTEWLPLGTFAFSAGEHDTDPSRVVQLVVDKDGIVSGTMVNQKTQQTYPVQGRVDKDTQRVAFTIGENKDVVFETGIYNLTQQQTPVLAHGEGREETYLLYRLEAPKDDAAAARTTPEPPKPLLP
jgi:hypothetical protein